GLVGGASVAAASWSPPAQLEGAPALNSVSCAPETSDTSGLCMTVSLSSAYTASNPSGSYSRSELLRPAGEHVHCFSVASCIVVGDGWVEIASISGSTPSWENNGANGYGFHAMACGSASFCIHTEGRRPACHGVK